MKKREGIIPLTQTEIMLVLATVILLLLVAKDASLNKATRKLKDLGAATAAPPSAPADPGAPVDTPLVAGGSANTDPPVLGSPDPGQDGRDGNRDDTSEPAQVPPNSDPHNSDPSVAPTPDPAPHPDPVANPNPAVPSPVPDSTIATDPVPSPPKSDNNTPGRLVGFDPCWRRDANIGRQYYYVYDVTFERGSDEGRFLISPHSDLQAGIPIIDDALQGDLKVLLAYPRQPMTFDNFREFGRDIESALTLKRQERPDYTENCLLAVTLDGDAPGRVAEFVRVVVGLYPITR